MEPHSPPGPKPCSTCSIPSFLLCCRSGLWAIKKKNGGKFPTHAKKVAAPAEASKKESKFYAAGAACRPLLLLLVLACCCIIKMAAAG